MTFKNSQENGRKFAWALTYLDSVSKGVYFMSSGYGHHIGRVLQSHATCVTSAVWNGWNGDFSTTGGTVSENEKHNCYTSENLTFWKVKVWFRWFSFLNTSHVQVSAVKNFAGCKKSSMMIHKKQPEVFKLSQLLEVFSPKNTEDVRFGRRCCWFGLGT